MTTWFNSLSVIYVRNLGAIATNWEKFKLNLQYILNQFKNHRNENSYFLLSELVNFCGAIKVVNIFILI